MLVLEGFWDAALKRVRPFGVDLFCLGKKFLVYNLVSRNLIIKYRRSALGVLWTVLAPTGLAAIYYFVFQSVLKIQVPNYLGFVLSGMFLWTYFARTLIEGTESLVQNFSLLTKIPIPPQVFPLVVSLTHLVNLVLAIPVLWVGVRISGVGLGPAVSLVPFYFVSLFLIAFALALILAYGFVYFRDLRHVIEMGMQVWFYATPVLYDAEMIPVQYRWILYINPVGLLFQHVHLLIIRGIVPPLSEMAFVVTWTILLVSVAALLYRKGCQHLAELL